MPRAVALDLYLPRRVEPLLLEDADRLLGHAYILGPPRRPRRSRTPQGQSGSGTPRTGDGRDLGTADHPRTGRAGSLGLEYHRGDAGDEAAVRRAVGRHRGGA